MNAVVNSVIKGKEDAVDLQLFDVEKCFDSLWVEECINDIYEAGLDNDKLAILYKENQNSACAVKVNDVLSKRFNMKNIVMQGTVFGILCELQPRIRSENQVITMEICCTNIVV